MNGRRALFAFVLLLTASFLLAGCVSQNNPASSTGYTPSVNPSDLAGQVQGLNLPSASDVGIPSIDTSTGFENQSVSLP